MTIQYGINSDSWQKIINITVAQFAVDKIVLFGSRAKGNYRDSSDIDLCLFGDLALTNIYQINNALDGLMLPYKIDIIIYKNITNQALIEHIERVGIVLYQRES